MNKTHPLLAGLYQEEYEENNSTDNAEDSTESMDSEFEVDTCPECGSENISIDEKDGMYCVKCNDCGYSSDEYETPEEAVESWNE